MSTAQIVGILLAALAGGLSAALVGFWWRRACFGRWGSPLIGALSAGLSAPFLQALGSGRLGLDPRTGIIEWDPVIATLLAGAGCGAVATLAATLAFRQRWSPRAAHPLPRNLRAWRPDGAEPAAPAPAVRRPSARPGMTEVRSPVFSASAPAPRFAGAPREALFEERRAARRFDWTRRLAREPEPATEALDSDAVPPSTRASSERLARARAAAGAATEVARSRVAASAAGALRVAGSTAAATRVGAGRAQTALAVGGRVARRAAGTAADRAGGWAAAALLWLWAGGSAAAEAIGRGLARGFAASWFWTGRAATWTGRAVGFTAGWAQDAAARLWASIISAKRSNK